MATPTATDLWRMTHRLLAALHEMGIHTPNTSGFPIVEIPLANHEDIDEVGRYLFEHGQYATMAAYPLVPKNEVGFRIQVTAANTDEADRRADRRSWRTCTSASSSSRRPPRRRVAARRPSPEQPLQPRRTSAPPSHPPSTRMSVPVT